MVGWVRAGVSQLIFSVLFSLDLGETDCVCLWEERRDASAVICGPEERPSTGFLLWHLS